MGDLIDRQAAIDAINKAFERVFAWDGTSPLGDKVLENVPSAQPDPEDTRGAPAGSAECNVERNINSMYIIV